MNVFEHMLAGDVAAVMGMYTRWGVDSITQSTF